MPKKPFRVGLVYELNLRGHIAFGPVPEQILWHKFTDGRIFGFLGEALIEVLYNNLSKAPSEGSPFDFIDRDGAKYEVRTLTSASGASLLPSSQIGTGRKYDAAAYEARRRSIHAYVFIDNRNSPTFRIVGILESDMPHKKKITAIGFDRLIADFESVVLRV